MLSRAAIPTYEALRAQALAGQGAGDGWRLLVRYGVCQGLARWERGCADTRSAAFAGVVSLDLAGDAALGVAASSAFSHLVPAELIHAMAAMVLNLTPKEPSHAR